MAVSKIPYGTAGVSGSTDTSLTIANAPADAKAVGDELGKCLKLDTQKTLNVPDATIIAGTIYGAVYG